MIHYNNESKPEENDLSLLVVALNFPDEYYPGIAPWSKWQVDAIRKHTKINLEVVVPRPYTPPSKFFPYHKFNNLPKSIVSDFGYHIHYPRFPYLIPKRYFFPLTGDLYSLFISKYILNNLNRPDLIHARFGYLDGYGALKACQKWEVPLIFDVHGSQDIEMNGGSKSLLEKQTKAFDYATRILCVAKWQIKECSRRGIPEEKLEYVPLGVDIDKYKPRNRTEMRKNLKINGRNIDDRKIVLYVGQLMNRKGIEYLIEAISLLDRSTRKDVKFIIVGDGPDKGQLMRLSEKLGAMDSILFTGYVKENDLLNLYSLADLFVLPSLDEGKPVVINEAMASECAIVATNIRGIAEQVTNGHNGFLVEPRDPIMLAQKMGYLLNNEEEMHNIGRINRRKIIDEDLTWEGYAKRVYRIYNDINQ